MKDLVKDLLEAAGIAVGADVFCSMEAWLGLTDGYEGLSFEDAPVDAIVYDKARELFLQVWSPQGAAAIMTHSNLFLESQVSPNDMTVETVMDAVRATRWLRYWMDLQPAMPDEDEMHDEEVDSQPSLTLMEQLLQLDTDHALLKALFQHVQQLPALQSQILLYTQSLQRGDAASSGKALQDPKSRLQQYERAQQVATKLQAEWQEHVDRLELIVGEWYRLGDPSTRKVARRQLGRLWSLFVHQSGAAGVRQENTRAAGVPMTLNVLHRILLGVTEIKSSHEHLLFHHLIPLHKPDAMVLWRDQTAVLELYHEPLTQSMAVILQKKPALIHATIQALIQPDVFPTAGNTPKQVLLLHEIDTYIGLLEDISEDDSGWLKALLSVLARYMSSEHSRVAERALSIFKNKQFDKLVEKNAERALQVLLPALVKREPSWNPTVRKMTYNILKRLKEHDADVFEKACNQVFSDHPAEPPKLDTGTTEIKPTVSRISTRTHSEEKVVPTSFSLKAGMGDWRPPPRAPASMPPPASRTSMLPPLSRPPFRGNPPSTVTGIAPWAKSTGAAPPLTVTGVAPWAMQPPTDGGHKRRAQEAHLGEIPEAKSGEEPAPQTGFERVQAYMEKIKPAEEEEGASSWSKAQMAESPTLLPKLKFHDLVFGQDLGVGSFGSVKYARLIDKTKTRSHWAEYAVKVISTQKIREMGYEASVQREIAVLRVLSHPGIARLVSSFRFREGAYLVLEYASGGDLHTLLRKHGSLDLDSTRFVVGEIVAALASIHDMGLVYADLKPENVVITEPGHIKLTDFGGCRPLTEEARTMIRSIAQDALKHLRDGDWKPKSPAKEGGEEEQAEEKEEEDGSSTMEEDSAQNVAEEEEEEDMRIEEEEEEDMRIEEEEEDMRIEGTTAYLPPEVVMGSIPTYVADSWALGCVMYQCLSGRPPLLEADDAATRHRIVSFDVQQDTSEVDRLFLDKHASGIAPEAKDMIKALLERDVSMRPRMSLIAEHDFFTEANVDVYTLHRQAAYPLDVGAVAPAPDAQWSRRQFSSIWAPQPAVYDIALPDEDEAPSFYGGSFTGPIAEGEEAPGFFSGSGSVATGTLGNISERIPTQA